MLVLGCWYWVSVVVLSWIQELFLLQHEVTLKSFILLLPGGSLLYSLAMLRTVGLGYLDTLRHDMNITGVLSRKEIYTENMSKAPINCNRS